MPYIGNFSHFWKRSLYYMNLLFICQFAPSWLQLYNHIWRSIKFNNQLLLFEAIILPNFSIKTIFMIYVVKHYWYSYTRSLCMKLVKISHKMSLASYMYDVCPHHVCARHHSNFYLFDSCDSILTWFTVSKVFCSSKILCIMKCHTL